MSLTWQEGGRLARLVRAIALGALTALILLALYLTPDLLRVLLPSWMIRHPIEWTAAAFLAGYSAAWRLTKSRHGSVPWVARLARVLHLGNAVSGKLLQRWLAVGFAGLSTLCLLAWIPHYLYWPWCRDADTYALVAQEWDSGVLPYRDIRAFNFPGHIYLHWILGKLFGWGHTGLFYALDATALLFLGAVVMAWSRRRLGLSLPGTAVYLFFLAYYLDISFMDVAQRDWHAPLCTTLGLLMLEAWPGRCTRWLSALLAAIAFTIRPNVVLFLPALLVAATSGDVTTRGALPADSARITARRTILLALEWIAVFTIFAAVAFAPLLLSGLLDDLVRELAILRPGGSHSDATTARSVAILWEELRQPKTWALGISLLLLSSASRDRDLKLMARTWLLALTGALIYRPIHPLDHGYLRTALALVGAVAWAVPIAWIIRAATAEWRMRSMLLPAVLGILLIVYEEIPMQIPGNCSVRVTIDSIRAAATGGWPALPPGAWIWYSPKRSSYNWDAYCRLLKYIREKTGPKTIVANVLKNPPFPSANGATGRRSPFRVESGVPWMAVVAEDLDETFAGELERLGCDSIVVWSPAEIDKHPVLPLKRLTSVIVDRYEPEARFGVFEVWRRKCAAPEDAGSLAGQSTGGDVRGGREGHTHQSGRN
jgi:hypothetical protein